MEEVKVKLPKQWGRWLEKAGLRVVGKYQRCWWSKCYMVGYNRQWRINCFGKLDVSCLNNEFDRWANSWVLSGEFHNVITNEKEFVQQVKLMLQTARDIEKK
jgi:hypothetical protein